MPKADQSGDALRDVARIHPLVERLRRLVESATLLDLKATAGTYWTGGRGQRRDDARLPRAGTA